MRRLLVLITSSIALEVYVSSTLHMRAARTPYDSPLCSSPRIFNLVLQHLLLHSRLLDLTAHFRDAPLRLLPFALHLRILSSSRQVADLKGNIRVFSQVRPVMPASSTPTRARHIRGSGTSCCAPGGGGHYEQCAEEGVDRVARVVLRVGWGGIRG
ncbi:hypothetical protein C8J57DRAFT_1516189 [Mycena rebaudengoi]|nr:hypothetical protein C8J57DRAFT_1516189 [Mycena rebaudengoi]